MLHFTARTLQSKAETEVHLKIHTESMMHLRICDFDGEGGDALFSRSSRTVNRNGAKTKAHAKRKAKPSSLGRVLGTSLLAIMKKGKEKNEEVAEAISPGDTLQRGGHV